MKSAFLTIDWKDAIKGLIVAVITAVISALLAILKTGQLPTPADWQQIGIIALTAGLSYILKNWLTSSDDKFMTPEVKKEI